LEKEVKEERKMEKEKPKTTRRKKPQKTGHFDTLDF
jgi:hypothetical protein